MKGSFDSPRRGSGSFPSSATHPRDFATRFTTLIPGHGASMTRDQFLSWRRAFNNLVDCGASARPRDECVAGWRRDAAAFSPAGREAIVDQLAGYYIDSRLRSAPEERRRYCPPA